MRQPVPDFLKGIAVIAMIQVHVMEQFARPEVQSGTIGKISLFLGGPPAAPVFMAMMGYFLAISKKGPGEKARRGALLLLLGLLLNIGINFSLLLQIFSGQLQADPFAYIFGVDILFLAGLSIFFIAMLERVFPRTAFPALVLMVIVPAVTRFLPDFSGAFRYPGAFLGGHAWWSYFPLFPWLAYPLAGYGYRKMEATAPSEFEWFRKKKLFVILPLLVFLLAFSGRAFYQITNLPAYYHHGIILFCWNIGFVAVLAIAVKAVYNITIDSKVMDYIRWLGINVTVVYVIQWLIIGNLSTRIHGTQYILPLVLWFAGIMLVTSLACFLYLKLKLKR